MLDSLFGRAELKERIAELEAEQERLERQLEAAEERRRTAVRERQNADEHVNELEDKIVELEDRLDRADTDESGPAFTRLEPVSHTRAAELVDRLASVRTEPEAALSAYVTTDRRPSAVTDLFGTDAALVDRAAPCLVYGDDARVVSVALDPPLPPQPFCDWDETFRVDPSWFVPTGAFALALVRSDLFALGVYDGTERERMEGFRSDVQGDHSKGGFSQGRFERRRDDQVDEHLERCEAVLDDIEVERVIVVGERTVLSRFREGATVTVTVDATGDPETALDAAFRSFWRTQVYGL